MTQKNRQEDIPIKSLIKDFPRETLELFLLSLAKEKGEAVACEDVSTEVMPVDPSKSSGFLDIAFKFTWKDGTEAIILLIEHWSDLHKISERRLGRYLFELLLRNEKALVQPIILVTDPRTKRVPTRFEYKIEGKLVLSLRYKVVQVTQSWVRRIKKLRNPVGVVLWILEPRVDPVRRGVEIAEVLLDLGYGNDMYAMAKLLAQLQTLANMSQVQSEEFLVTLRERPKMTTVVEMLKAEGMAEGRAEGEAKGEAKILKTMMDSGMMTIDQALEMLKKVVQDGKEFELARSILLGKVELK